MAKKRPEKEAFADASEFERDGVFTFPFTPLDPTPGGSNLGRIEWHVELFPAARKRRGENRIRLREIHVWASQTRDPRYAGKCFRFETIAESLTHRYLDGNGFQPWRTQFCERHRGALVLSAYPENHHRALVVAADSSISCEVHFK